MKFVDEATIDVKAGKGGAGSVHFRREKYVPEGGPDGGDGGAGGSVILIADSNIHTLLDFHFQPKWNGENGGRGGGSGKSGGAGEDLIIKLPLGTQIFKQPDNQLVIDLTTVGQEFILAKGGRGGKGNEFFKSSTNRAPRHAQPGEAGEEGTYLLSLKLVAEVGLVGFPNAGKSTLISRISAARPKIADYPFTTLTPNLGVAKSRSGRSFVVADIPGLIPGAHQGKGLGIQFLKHIERTKVLAHLIDPNQTDPDGELISPEKSFDLINTELKNFSETLSAKKQIVVISKIDTINEKDIAKFTKKFKSKGFECFAISSVSGAGLDELLDAFSLSLG
ncbi:MAG: GTPase ObgE [bacterium]|nr:GTPase ObgE [bacterium]